MLNKVILVGRLTADPQYSQTPNGASMCRFTVAVDRPFVSKATNQREADFINVIAWRQTADFVSRYFRKGSVIIVEGSLRNDNYERDGVKHYSMNVQADNVSFAGSQAETGSGNMGGNVGNGSYNGGNYGGSYNNSYNNNSYGNGYANNSSYNGGNNGYNGGNAYNSTPNQMNNVPPQNDYSNIQSTDNLELGDMSGFEEIISDGEVPF